MRTLRIALKRRGPPFLAILALLFTVAVSAALRNGHENGTPDSLVSSAGAAPPPVQRITARSILTELSAGDPEYYTTISWTVPSPFEQALLATENSGLSSRDSGMHYLVAFAGSRP